MLLRVLLFTAAFNLSFTGFCQDKILDLKEFIVSADAKQEGDQCFNLTPAEVWKGGSVWYRNQVDLRQSFDMQLDLHLGCKDYGADGIVFIFHPNLQTGFEGEGIGFGGLQPSIGIEMDTYQNHNLNDPGYDHVALMRDGKINHHDGITEPIPLRADYGDVEDCQSHKVRVQWNPKTLILNFQFDQSSRISQRIDLIDDIFKGDPIVYWGFTAATGGEHNQHRICIEQTDFLEVASFDYDTKQKLLASKKYILKEVEFNIDHKILNEEDIKELDNLVKLMNSYPEYSMVIEGHTDDQGSSKTNAQISKLRAEAIVKYLLSKGIDPKRLTFYGLGEDYPIAPNNTEAGREKNRRIQVSMQLDRV